MGIHIIPYILNERVEGDYGDKYWLSSQFEGFDSVRHVGDREFISTKNFEWIEELDNPEAKSFGESGRNYVRPKNIDKAIDWVTNNIGEGNKKRLIDLLNKMKEEENIFLYCAH